MLELAQRKLLRHIVLYSGSIDIESYPRLILVDFRSGDDDDKMKVRAEIPSGGFKEQLEVHTGKHADIQQDHEGVHNDVPSGKSENGNKSTKYCFRLLCEYEQGWHGSSELISFPDMDTASLEEFLKSVSPYLARVLAILKYSRIDLPILTSPEGDQLCRKLEEVYLFLCFTLITDKIMIFDAVNHSHLKFSYFLPVSPHHKK